MRWDSLCYKLHCVTHSFTHSHAHTHTQTKSWFLPLQLNYAFNLSLIQTRKSVTIFRKLKRFHSVIELFYNFVYIFVFQIHSAAWTMWIVNIKGLTNAIRFLRQIISWMTIEWSHGRTNHNWENIITIDSGNSNNTPLGTTKATSTTKQTERRKASRELQVTDIVILFRLTTI